MDGTAPPAGPAVVSGNAAVPAAGVTLDDPATREDRRRIAVTRVRAAARGDANSMRLLPLVGAGNVMVVTLLF